MTTESESVIQEAAIDISEAGKQSALPVPGTDEQKPIPAATEENAETPEQQEAKKQSKFQRRLERQKTARIEAQTEARLLRERVQQLEAQSKPSQEAVEPKREDFQSDDAFLKAFIRYEAKQELAEVSKAEREAQQGKEKQSQQTAGNQKIAQEWTEREKVFQAATKDYLEVVTPYTEDEIQHLAQPSREYLVQSEVGPALLHYLASHPDEHERIAELSAVRQVAELGKLESKVSMPAKRTTAAPPPANITQGGKTASKDISKMSQQEYEAYRKANGARWA